MCYIPVTHCLFTNFLLASFNDFLFGLCVRFLYSMYSRVFSIFFFCRLLLLLSEQGTILDRSWRQLREYDSQASQVLPWLNSAEDTLARYMAQPVKPDPTAIKQQISDLQVTGNKETRLNIKKGVSLGSWAVLFAIYFLLQIEGLGE